MFFHDIYAVYWHFGGGLNNTQGGLVFVSVCPLHMFALCEGKALRNSSPSLFQPDTRAQHFYERSIDLINPQNSVVISGKQTKSD